MLSVTRQESSEFLPEAVIRLPCNVAFQPSWGCGADEQLRRKNIAWVCALAEVELRSSKQDGRSFCRANAERNNNIETEETGRVGISLFFDSIIQTKVDTSTVAITESEFGLTQNKPGQYQNGTERLPELLIDTE